MLLASIILGYFYDIIQNNTIIFIILGLLSLLASISTFLMGTLAVRSNYRRVINNFKIENIETQDQKLGSYEYWFQLVEEVSIGYDPEIIAYYKGNPIQKLEKKIFEELKNIKESNSYGNPS